MTTTAGTTDPLAGRLLDERYRLDSLIARGGMATVYLGTDTRLDRTVAVKVMHRELAADPEFVARFRREARASARLSLPEVVAVHDQGDDASTGLAYLVLEHVPGRTLRALLREDGPLPPRRALDLLEPVLTALAAAHEAGLVHRDVKPENVLLGDGGRVKVADFGLARAVEATTRTATTGLLIGTVAYLAPEQIVHGQADARTDVYAAGVVLWELLTGTPPYAGSDIMSVAYAHVHQDVPPPSTVVSGIPPALDALVTRATRRDPEQRQPDAGAFLVELRATRAQLPVDAVPPTRRDTAHPTLVVPRRPVTRPDLPAPRGAVAVPAPRSRRRGRVLMAVVAVLALLALGGGYYLGSYRYTRAPAVLGESEAAARSTLRAAGLQVRLAAARHDEARPKGQVLAQQPGPKARLLKHATVTLVLSLGADRRGVPGVVGSAEKPATAALAAAGLRPGAVTREYSSTVPAGEVIRTDPVAGKAVRPGTPVALVVSRGVQQLPVPDVRQRPEADAVAQLKAAGFVVTVQQAFSDTVAAGLVADQSPSRGAAGRGSTVTVVVSKGPDVVVVPADLVGTSRDAAVARLTAAGLTARVRSLPGPGRVLSTSPSGGATVRRGSTVTLYVF